MELHISSFCLKMSNSVAPESSDRPGPVLHMPEEKKSLSEQLLAELTPKISVNEELPSRMHVNEFTPGEIIGNESLNKLPPLKGKEAAFIPLHLARDYVKKVRTI